MQKTNEVNFNLLAAQERDVFLFRAIERLSEHDRKVLEHEADHLVEKVHERTTKNNFSFSRGMALELLCAWGMKMASGEISVPMSEVGDVSRS